MYVITAGPMVLELFSPKFVNRFERFCGAVARFIKQYTDRVPFYSPINQISFLSWVAGQVGFIHPCRTDQGVPLKDQLVRAAIAGIEAIWAVDPSCAYHTHRSDHACAHPARAAPA